jgi:hypothetical protein
VVDEDCAGLGPEGGTVCWLNGIDELAPSNRTGKIWVIWQRC